MMIYNCTKSDKIGYSSLFYRTIDLLVTIKYLTTINLHLQKIQLIVQVVTQKLMIVNKYIYICSLIVKRVENFQFHDSIVIVHYKYFLNCS